MPQQAFLIQPDFKIHLFVFFLVTNAAIIVLLLRRHLRTKYAVDYKVQQAQEEINILNEAIDREEKIKSAQEARILRYASLKRLVEEINREFDYEATAEQLLEAAFSLISNKKGACLLYLAQGASRKPALFKAKKEDRRLVVKAKEGDIFDAWVMRHNTPLFIEDVNKDYRFDTGRIEPQERRTLASLVSAPILTNRGFLGLMRLEHPEPGYYSQDDLRMLSTICDLGAVTLESEELYRKTEELAIHDGLTSFLTRGYFIEAIKNEIKRNLRSKGAFSLLLADLDHFKVYNDRFGHMAGDEVLRVLSRVFKEQLAELNPIISRYGGEEFCIILPGISKSEALNIALALCKRMERERIVLRRKESSVTVSIGVAAFPDDAVNAEDLIKKSDAAMYRAKEQGRNRACSV
jgi:diguanylate cyclase (GGDEF)-like protein